MNRRTLSRIVLFAALAAAMVAAYAYRDWLNVAALESWVKSAGALGHIAGSLNIPIDELPRRLAELEPRRELPIAVICRTNRMSGKAVQLLRETGCKQAPLVDDGMVGWQRQQGQAVFARRGHQVPDGAVDLEKLFAELMECVLEVRACAMAMNECRLDERDLIAGVQTGSMTALAGWLKESDIVLTF